MTIAITGTHVKTVLACALILSLTSCAKTNAAGENAANAAGAAPLVPVAKAARADLASDVVLTAEFQPFQQVDVMAKVAGYVRSIKVDMGDRVREGQVLATLEIPEMEDDLARGAAAIDQADAEIATASDELHRAEAVHDWRTCPITGSRTF
jgi:multidrug efflux pump subunit AcrA (membrane-fusion protein)